MNRKVLFIGVGISLLLSMSASAELSQQSQQKLDANYTLAVNYIKNGEYEKAEASIDACLELMDDSVSDVFAADVHLKKGCILTIHEDFENAVAELDEALSLDASLADAYLVKSQIYVAQEDMDQAVPAYESYLRSLGIGDAQLSYEKAVFEMEHGLYEKANEDFNLVAEDETYGDAAEYNKSVCLMNQGNYAEAAEGFQTALEEERSYDGTFYNLGICYMMQDMNDEAVEVFQKSLEQEGYQDEAGLDLGISLIGKGEYEKAVVIFTDLIDRGATTTDNALYYRGVIYAADEAYDEALSDFSKCIEDGFNLADSYYQRANVYNALGSEEEYISDLEFSLQY